MAKHSKGDGQTPSTNYIPRLHRVGQQLGRDEILVELRAISYAIRKLQNDLSAAEADIDEIQDDLGL